MAKNKKTNSKRPNKAQQEEIRKKCIEQLASLEVSRNCMLEIMDATGVSKRIDEMIGRTYLFILFAIQNMDELVDTLEIYGAKLQYAKPILDKTRRDMDDFCKYVYKMIKEKGEEYKKKAIDDVCNQLAILEDVFFENFPAYKKDWKPTDNPEAVAEISRRYGKNIKIEFESGKVKIISAEKENKKH